MTAEQQDRITTAYHEAGHAVIGFLYGLEPYRATIVPTDALKGEVRQKYFAWQETFPPHIASRIIFALAGPTARNRYYKSDDDLHRHGGEQDVEKAAHDVLMLFMLTDGTAGEFEEFVAFTEHAVRHYWRAIDAFARLLLNNEVIEGEELIDALVSVIGKIDYLHIWDHLCPMEKAEPKGSPDPPIRTVYASGPMLPPL